MPQELQLGNRVRCNSEVNFCWHCYDCLYVYCWWDRTTICVGLLQSGEHASQGRSELWYVCLKGRRQHTVSSSLNFNLRVRILKCMSFIKKKIKTHCYNIQIMFPSILPHRAARRSKESIRESRRFVGSNRRRHDNEYRQKSRRWMLLLHCHVHTSWDAASLETWYISNLLNSSSTWSFENWGCHDKSYYWCGRAPRSQGLVNIARDWAPLPFLPDRFSVVREVFFEVFKDYKMISNPGVCILHIQIIWTQHIISIVIHNAVDPLVACYRVPIPQLIRSSSVRT